MTILIVYLIIGVLFSVGFCTEFYKNDTIYHNMWYVRLFTTLAVIAIYPAIIGGLVGEKFK